MKRFALLAVLFGVLALFVYALTLEKDLASPLVGRPAPAFAIPRYDPASGVGIPGGASIDLAALEGRVVVLNFWASWCLSCRDEAAVLEAAWRRHGPEVAFVGVAVADDDGPARAFIERYGKTYGLGPDVDGAIALDYGLFGVPETFFIGPDGRVLSKHVGPVSPDELDRRIAEARAGLATGETGSRDAVEPIPRGGA